MFPLRHTLSNLRQALPRLQSYSSSSGPLIDVAVDNEGIATVTMQQLPVNSLNLELLQAFNTSLDDLAKNKARALILTSAAPTTFSAGLDIMEMYKPDLKRAELFWTTLQEVWIKYYGTPMITAAAINGHAPAGGCLLALSSEYRAMVSGKYAIGLNETALGIVAPVWFQDCLFRAISSRQAEVALTLGSMFPVDEALKLGMIDTIAQDKADAISKCKEFIKKFDKIPPMARAFTKQRIRQEPIMRLKNSRQQDTQEFLAFLKDEKVQMGLEFYMNNLKKKAAKKYV